MATNNRIFGFLTFRLCLLACYQVLFSVKSLFNLYCKSAGLLELRVSLVLLAYILGTEYRGHAGRSFGRCSSSRKVSHEWLATLREYNRTNNRNNAP